MKRIKIAFLFQAPSFWPSWESLYESLALDERFEVKMFWLNGEAGDKSQMHDADAFLIRKAIDFEIFTPERVQELAPDYLVYQTPYDKGHRDFEAWSIRYKLLGIRIVYIPYGIEISDTHESRYKHFSLSVVLNSDKVFTLSEVMREEYVKYCINCNSVVATGLTRFDSLCKNYIQIPEVKEKAKGHKIVLWKAHFPKVFWENGIKKQATPDIKEYFKFLEYIKSEKELFFVFMPHPKFTDKTVDEELRMLAVKLIDELESISNVYIDRADDYRPSLVNADAIIVDRSAVMVEAGVKGVPVLYMYNHNYEEPMTPPIDDILNSYYRGTTAKEMISFCIDVKDERDPLQRKRIETFNRNVSCLDGNVSSKIKEELIDYVHCTPNVNRLFEGARIIIFGSGDIGKKCIDIYQKSNHLNLQVIACVDNNAEMYGKKTSLQSVEIFSPEIIRVEKFDFIVVATEKYYREIYIQLVDTFDVSKECIINFDQFIIQCLYGNEIALSKTEK